jgi:hypothetical protein
LLSYWVKLLAFPAALVDVVLRRDEVLAMSAEDAVDYYNRFVVSRARTLRTALSTPVHRSEVEGFAAFPKESKRQSFIPCIAALAMGDCQAVEIGQLAHLAIACRAGAICNNTVIARELPVPRSDYFSGIIIDDFVSFEKEKGVLDSSGILTHATFPPHTSVAAAKLICLKDEYAKHHLQHHPAKGISREFRTTLWGSETDGVVGWHAAPLKRTAALSKLTCSIVEIGFLLC